MGRKRKAIEPTETTLSISHLTGKRRGAILKEEVVHKGAKVVKYSLTYINPRVCSLDNGRVLGYDSSHGYHHRHFMGVTEAVAFPGYESLVEAFRQEVAELWRSEDEQKA